MKKDVRLALAQINSTVGDLDLNAAKIIEYVKKAKAAKADIIAFPELALCGYPPEDLVLKPKFVRDNRSKLDEIAETISDIVAVVGFVDQQENCIYNAAAVIYNGKVAGVYHKMFLPNYSVFDEKRYFAPGKRYTCFKYDDIIFGVNICEDIWYEDGPAKHQAKEGARLIVNINASPFYAGKFKAREQVIEKQAAENDAVISYTNMVGGQDELVFDGQSMVADDNGTLIAKAAAFKEEMILQDVQVNASAGKLLGDIIHLTSGQLHEKQTVMNAGVIPEPGTDAEIYEGLKTGLRDYVSKNGFNQVVVALSGGIDSALVTVLAVDALGKDNVTVVFMPSRYTADESGRDSEELAKNLGIKMLTIPIEDIFKTYLRTLEPYFEGMAPNIAEENLQSRIRGNLIMALSNKFGWLVLTTGNKSEMSTGYATLYGDMAGGFAVIKDVPKVVVYDLAKYRNTIGHVIPENIIVRPPTAELKPDQKDTDTLPPYEVLDQILKAYVEENKSVGDIIDMGFDRNTIQKVIKMVDLSEYKRRQAPPGIKITPRAFGKDRRMPITNRYREWLKG